MSKLPFTSTEKLNSVFVEISKVVNNFFYFKLIQAPVLSDLF